MKIIPMGLYKVPKSKRELIVALYNASEALDRYGFQRPNVITMHPKKAVLLGVRPGEVLPGLGVGHVLVDVDFACDEAKGYVWTTKEPIKYSALLRFAFWVANQFGRFVRR